MKKVLLYIAIIGIALGIILGIRNEIMSNETNLENQTDESSGDEYIHELNIPIMEIDSFNPLLTYNKQVMYILSLIYEPLVTIDKEDRIKPVLATEWAQINDTNYIIKLRNDVSWHNGNAFTAQDVVFTVNQLLDENISSPYKENVKNIVSIEAIDNYSVSINLAEKDELLIYKLLFPIIPYHYFKDGEILNNNKNNIPVGTGPYKYATTNDSETVMKLVYNSIWWNKENEIRLENIYLYKYETYGEAIKAYKSSEVDLIMTTMADWDKKFGTIGNNIYSYESSVFDTIIPNTQKLALSDSSVRKAILFAINRENIISKVYNSNATIVDLPIHTRSSNYLSNMQSEYSIDSARQILINAGWNNNSNIWSKDISGTNCKLKFTMIVNKDNTEHINSAEIIKDNLKDVGIEITVKELSWKDYEDSLNKGNFDLALASLDIKNEFTILDLIETNNSMNFSKYSNDMVNVAIEELKINYTKEGMENIEKTYKSETPYIGLFFRNNTILTNKSVKGSIEPIWCNPYEYITTWCK